MGPRTSRYKDVDSRLCTAGVPMSVPYNTSVKTRIAMWQRKASYQVVGKPRVSETVQNSAASAARLPIGTRLASVET